MTLLEHSAQYQDTPEAHQALFDLFTTQVQATPHLKQHRDLVEEKSLGYGERPFHWLWKLLMDELPENFKFLEIGVFQGQVLSLMGLLAKKACKKGTIVGVTPLNSAGDHAGDHPETDYLAGIKFLHSTFGLSSPKILHGYSYDPRIQKLAAEQAPYDAVYVDGCHDFEVAQDDLREYSPLVKSGGYLIVDDCATDLRLPVGMWAGIPQVTEALKCGWDRTDARFREVLSIGHIRVWKKD